MSNTNSYIVLTEQGLSAVKTQPWPQIAIKYFLPMYDERIDSLIHTESGITSVVPLSASITSADSQASLIGERIYNIPSTSGTYQLTTKNVASSAAGASFAPPETIFASTVNKGCSRTLINGKALSPVVSGNVEPIYDISSGRLQFVGGSATALPVNSWTINGSNIPRENLFDSVAFNPTQVTSGSYNVISGLFKFTLKNDIGNYRFNKIAFFIQPMNEDGTINTYYDPVLFGQAVVDVSQTVEVGGKGSQSFEVPDQRHRAQILPQNRLRFLKTPRHGRTSGPYACPSIRVFLSACGRQSAVPWGSGRHPVPDPHSAASAHRS